MPVYAAGEVVLAGADSQALADALFSKNLTDAIVMTDEHSLFAILEEIIQDNDLVLTMGAGSIGRFAQEAFEQFNQSASHYVN